MGGEREAHAGVAHGVIRHEADGRAGDDGRGARLARGVHQVELVAAELGVVHVRELYVRCQQPYKRGNGILRVHCCSGSP